MTMYAAKILAAGAVELMTNPKLLEEAKAEHRKRVGPEGYVPPMPGWVRSMTPLHEWYGEVLGISDTFMQAEIEPAIHESVTSTFRAIFD